MFKGGLDALTEEIPFLIPVFGLIFHPLFEFRGMSADCRQIKNIYLKRKITFRKTPPQLGWTVVLFTSPFLFSLCLPVCEKDMQKVCANSSEENLQPFKDKMEGFISDGESITAFLREHKPQMRPSLCPPLSDEEMLIKACF